MSLVIATVVDVVAAAAGCSAGCYAAAAAVVLSVVADVVDMAVGANDVATAADSVGPTCAVDLEEPGPVEDVEYWRYHCQWQLRTVDVGKGWELPREGRQAIEWV